MIFRREALVRAQKGSCTCERKDSCQGLIKTLQDLKRDGVEQVNKEGVITHPHKILDFLEAQSTELSGAHLEKYKTELEVWAEAQKSVHPLNIELFKSTINAG